jgi:hypothetical protein
MRPYPWYYAVNDRPVKLVLTPSGGLDALVIDWESGAFVPDRSYFVKVSDTGIGKDVDQLTEEQFAQAVIDVRRRIVARLVTTALPWRATGDGEYPYRAEVNGHVYLIRVNDFPAEPIYTLLADDDELADLDDWPAGWTRPEAGR